MISEPETTCTAVGSVADSLIVLSYQGNPRYGITGIVGRTRRFEFATSILTVHQKQMREFPHVKNLIASTWVPRKWNRLALTRPTPYASHYV